jgi:hypothetical protein
MTGCDFGQVDVDEGAVKILCLDGEKEEKISDYFQEISEGEKVLKLGKKMVKIILE